LPNPVSEADLVEAAFEDEVKLLYTKLCVGLNDVGGVPRPAEEQQCLQRFKLGLTLARRARELALSAVEPAAPVRIAAQAESQLLRIEPAMSTGNKSASSRRKKPKSSAGESPTSAAPSGKSRARRR
jgi:hypothetical protein